MVSKKEEEAVADFVFYQFCKRSDFHVFSVDCTDTNGVNDVSADRDREKVEIFPVCIFMLYSEFLLPFRVLFVHGKNFADRSVENYECTKCQ